MWSFRHKMHWPSYMALPTRGIEPQTSGLQDLRSTTELYGLVVEEILEWCPNLLSISLGMARPLYT